MKLDKKTIKIVHLAVLRILEMKSGAPHDLLLMIMKDESGQVLEEAKKVYKMYA